MHSHATTNRSDETRSAADHAVGGSKSASGISSADRRPAGVALGKLARIVNRSLPRGTVQRYIVRDRFATEADKLTEEDVRADARWAHLNSRQQAELLRRVGTPGKELLDDAFTASALLFRDDEGAHGAAAAAAAPAAAASPAAPADEEAPIVPPSREGAHLDPERMFASAAAPRAARIPRPVALPLRVRLRRHAVTFGASQPGYAGPVRPTVFNFPPESPRQAPARPATPPAPSGLAFSFGAASAAAAAAPASEQSPGQGFSFGFGTAHVPPSSPPAATDTGEAAKTTSGSGSGVDAPAAAPAAGTGLTAAGTDAPTFGGFSLAASTGAVAATGGFSFGFGAHPAAAASGAAAGPADDSDSDDEAEPDPDRFLQSDQYNHQVLLNNPRYAGMVASTFIHRGPINVRTETASGADAAWRSENNTISITSKLTGLKRASAMVFEMTNAYHTPRADALKAQAESLGEERYAIAAERVEYDGIRMHHDIMAYGVEHLGWPPALDRYANILAGKWSTFEGYLATQEKKGHTNMHRSNHKIMMGKLEREREQAKAAIARQSHPL